MTPHFPDLLTLQQLDALTPNFPKAEHPAAQTSYRRENENTVVDRMDIHLCAPLSVNSSGSAAYEGQTKSIRQELVFDILYDVEDVPHPVTSEGLSLGPMFIIQFPI